jgi:hypothetical protein
VPAQPPEIDAEQLSFPFQHLAGDDDRLDVRALHQRDHGAGHDVEWRNVDRLSIEQDDVGVLARRQRSDLLVELQVPGAR